MILQDKTTILQSKKTTFLVQKRHKSVCFSKHEKHFSELSCHTPLSSKNNLEHSLWDNYQLFKEQYVNTKSSLLSKDFFINTKPTLLDLFTKSKEKFERLDEQITNLVNSHLDKPEAFIKSIDTNVCLNFSQSIHIGPDPNYLHSIFHIFHSFYIPNYCLPICVSILAMLFYAFINTIIMSYQLLTAYRGFNFTLPDHAFFILRQKIFSLNPYYKYKGGLGEWCRIENYSIKIGDVYISLIDAYIEISRLRAEWQECHRRIKFSHGYINQLLFALSIIAEHGAQHLKDYIHVYPVLSGFSLAINNVNHLENFLLCELKYWKKERSDNRRRGMDIINIFVFKFTYFVLGI